MKKFLIVIDVCTEDWALDKDVYIIDADNMNQAVDKILDMPIFDNDNEHITSANIAKIIDLSNKKDEFITNFNYYE